MNVIGHDDEGIQNQIGEMARNILPAVFNNLPCSARSA